MKNRVFLAFLALGAVGFVLQQGCNITYVVRTPKPARPAPYVRFPNATHIQARVNDQLNRISLALQQGSLNQETAFLLSQNDELVKRYAQEDRAPSNQTLDLTYDQMLSLNNMLNDNEGMIQDAIQNRQAYNQYFTGGSFDYASSGNSYMYLTYMDYQLRTQQSSVDAGVKSKQLSATDAQDLRQRIQAIQAAKANYYRANGRIDLSEDQVRQLSRMAEDNSKYLNYRLQGNRGLWDKEKFSNLKQQAPQGLAKVQGKHWGRNQNWRPPVNAVPTPVPTPAPTLVPTAIPTAMPQTVVVRPTPVPVPTKDMRFDRSKNMREFADRSKARNQGAPIAPVVPAPAPVVVPAAVPTAVPAVVVPTVEPTAVPAAVPAAIPTVVPTAVPAAVPAASLRLLPPGQLVQILKRADQSAKKAGDLSEDQAATLNQKLSDLQQKANDFQKQNQGRGVTQDQMNQLSGMAADMDQFIQDAQPDNVAPDNSDASQNPGRGRGTGRNKNQ